MTDNHDLRLCSNCWDEELLASPSSLPSSECSLSASRFCSCRAREYVEKEQVIAYLLLSEQERGDRQVVFGPDLSVQMGMTNLRHFFIANEQGLRLFFHMFDDVYANKESGEINLYRENDALDYEELESLLIDFTKDKREYLREMFDVDPDADDDDDYDDDDDEDDYFFHYLVTPTQSRPTTPT